MPVVQFLYKLSPPYPRAVLCVVNPFLFLVLAVCRRDREPGWKKGTPMYSVRNM